MIITVTYRCTKCGTNREINLTLAKAVIVSALARSQELDVICKRCSKSGNLEFENKS